MSRQIVRQMKRAVAAAEHPGAGTDALVLARASALSLLSRSIAFHHGRLAIIRLAMAVRAGADRGGAGNLNTAISGNSAT